jgi:hypothetical protein
MRLILFSIIYFITIPVFCQSNKPLHKLKQFILETYPKNKSSKDISHSIDTVIKLRNGNYFVLVINTMNGAANSESGTYDCYEISQPYQSFQIKHSILNNGDNTGGMGMVDLSYRLVYLNQNNYLLIANKNFIHHGNYNLLTLIVNSEKKYMETLATNDYSGITSDSSSNLSQIANIIVSKGIFKKMTFRYEKCEVSNDLYSRDFLIEKNYEIRATDFDLDVECITNIRLLNKKIKSLD